MLFERIDILGVKIGVTNISSACRIIEDWIRVRTKTYICIVPASTIVACCEDKKYCDVVNQAGLATPDGMPLVWLGRLKGHKAIERTYGPDLMRAVCQMGEERGYRHYFFGATDDVCLRLEAKLKEQCSGINIVGKFAPPFRAMSAQEDAQAVEAINRANPDVLWVGLGAPKQDFWMAEHRGRLNVPVIVAVGAAFDFLAGTKPQAPRWMQRAGLEWLFRLCCEPRRLWKRYLIGNTKFIYFLLQDIFKKHQRQ